jgi:alpha-D-ribose 1-methylphosphonate 5-triphosphate synthase subunit PhnG
VQHADALRRLGDLTVARSYAERSVAAAGESHIRGRVHRLATLATILADQGKADAAADIAGQMLDRTTGMESCRIKDRIIAVRDAVTTVSDGTAARELAERVEDVLGVPM